MPAMRWSLVLGLLALASADLSPEQLHSQTTTPGDCSKRAGEHDFVTIHFRSYFDDETPISST